MIITENPSAEEFTLPFNAMHKSRSRLPASELFVTYQAFHIS